MDEERWERLQRLFHDALSRAPHERERFLKEQEPDALMREEVHALLEADADEVTLEPVPREALARIMDDSGLLARTMEGRRVGPYTIIRHIGQGGMGAVYLAKREDVDLHVALKLVRGALGAPDMIQRFLFERRVLARLENPAIARLLDAGVADDDTPYFAMEYVDGAPITESCDAADLGIESRLRLFRDVCDAVAYAHRNLIVHRDIKPSNVMVTAAGAVKLLDFGIAKLLGDDDATLTRTGSRVMSPAYAAPEQLSGAPVTTSTDVYSLGVLLYELLTGERPGEPARDGDQAATRPAEMLPERRAVTTRPSAALARAGDAAGARRLAGDLDAICLRAMEPEPERRYRSAQQLCDDVGRYLRGLPVEARLPTFGYRAGKFLRRHALTAAATLVLLLSLGGGLGAAMWQGQRAERSAGEADAARQEMEVALDRSRTVTRFLIEMFEAADPREARGEQITALQLLDRGVERIDELQEDPPLQAELLETIASVNIQLGRYADAESLMRRAVTIRRTEPPGNPYVSALNVWGISLSHLGLPDSAAAAWQEAIDTGEPVLGAEHTNIIAARANLAVAYNRLGRTTEAQQLLRGIIATEERILDPDHPDRTYALNSLGLQLTNSGGFAEAEALLRESLRIRQAVDGADSPVTALAMDNLAGSLRDAGRYADAEPLFREAMEVRRSTLGTEHRLFGESLYAYGLMLALRGRGDDLLRSDSMLNAALGIYRTTLGVDHPGTAYVLHALGVLEERRDDLRAAEARYREALEIRRGTTRDNPAVAVFSLSSLARVLRRAGSGEAPAVAREAVDLAQDQLPDGHPKWAEADAELGLTLAAAGDSSAASHFTRGVATIESLYGSGHPRVIELCEAARRAALPGC